MIWVSRRKSPVSALRHVLGYGTVLHECIAGFCVLGCKTWFGDLFIFWLKLKLGRERGGRWSRVKGGGFCDFEERPKLAVAEEEGYGVCIGTFLVEKMYVYISEAFSLDFLSVVG